MRKSESRIRVEVHSRRTFECFKTARRSTRVGQSSKNQNGCVALGRDGSYSVEQIISLAHSSLPPHVVRVGDGDEAAVFQPERLAVHDHAEDLRLSN